MVSPQHTSSSKHMIIPVVYDDDDDSVVLVLVSIPCYRHPCTHVVATDPEGGWASCYLLQRVIQQVIALLVLPHHEDGSKR